MAKSKNLSEFELIRLFRRSSPKKPVILGPGDDAAAFRSSGKPLLVTTDMLLEGRHFRRDWMSLEDIGYKSILVNTSDIAAMGGKPLYAVIAAAFPRCMTSSDIQKLFSGILKGLAKTGTQLIGGDTNRGDRLILSVTLIGEARHRLLTRSGAKVGDFVYVTGELGCSALGLVAFQKKKAPIFSSFVDSHARPPDRCPVGLQLASLPKIHAAIDLSDGLAGDVRHILEESRVGAEIDMGKLPLSTTYRKACERLKLKAETLAVTGGEDYELLFTASPLWKAPKKILGVKITKVGKILPKSRGLCFKDSSAVFESLQAFEHF